MTTKEELRSELGAASAEIKQLADERDEWRRQCGQAQATSDRWASEADRLRAHRERLAVEAGKLRGEYSRRNLTEATLRDQLSAANAEVERLRAELDGRERRYVAAQEQRNEAQTRLAAANALRELMSDRDAAKREVERLRAELKGVRGVRDRAVSGRIKDREQLAAANVLLGECYRWHCEAGPDDDPPAALAAWHTAHLAGQAKAEPSSGDTKRREPGCECHQEEGDSPCVVHGLYEAEKPSRTAAEQRVLDAMKNFVLIYNALPAIPTTQQWKRLCVATMKAIEGWPDDDEAELARRDAV